MHKAWSSIEEVPYCFARSSVKFQGRTALKIIEFDPDWVFPDCNSSLNSPMATKWCTKLESNLRLLGRSQLSNPSDLPCLFITRVSEVIMFSPCVFVTLFVCLFVSLSRCLSGRFNYEGLVPHKQYFAGTLLGMSSCASYVSRTHDVIDDVTRSQSRSNFESDISPSIFELERWSKAQNVGNAHGYLSGLSNFRYNFR